MKVKKTMSKVEDVLKTRLTMSEETSKKLKHWQKNQKNLALKIAVQRKILSG